MKLYIYIGIVYAAFVTALLFKLYETNKRLLRENKNLRQEVLEKERYIELLQEGRIC